MFGIGAFWVGHKLYRSAKDFYVPALAKHEIWEHIQFFSLALDFQLERRLFSFTFDPLERLLHRALQAILQRQPHE